MTVRLTAEIAREIFASRETCRTTASRFGVSPSLVHHIRRRAAWADATKGLPNIKRRPAYSTKLTEAQVKELFLSNKSGVALARHYDVSESSVSNIRNGIAYKRLTARLAHPKGRANTTLTDDQIIEIYTSAEPGDVVAARLGISTSCISGIRTRKYYRALTRVLPNRTPKRNVRYRRCGNEVLAVRTIDPTRRTPRRLFYKKPSGDEVVQIFISRLPVDELAKRHHLDPSIIKAIKSGSEYTHITSMIVKKGGFTQELASVAR